MAGQKPMKVRLQETMELLWRHGRLRADRIEPKVLKKLIQQGKVKRDLVQIGFGHKTNSIVVPVEEKPEVVEVDTGGPFAKRRAEMDEASVHYQGKNQGRKKVVGERKLNKFQKKKLEKKTMWEKLKN